EYDSLVAVETVEASVSADVSWSAGASTGSVGVATVLAWLVTDPARAVDRCESKTSSSAMTTSAPGRAPLTSKGGRLLRRFQNGATWLEDAVVRPSGFDAGLVRAWGG